MQRFLTVLFTFVTASLFAQSIEIKADRDDCVYACNQKATFRVTVLDDNKQPLKDGQVTVKITNDGPKEIAAQTFDLAKANPISISGALDFPGFIRCSAALAKDGTPVKVKDKDGKDKPLQKMWAVAVDPLSIKPSVEEPADFVAFWQKAIAKLEKEVPTDVQLKKFDNFSNDKHTTYEISIAAFNGERVYGWLCVPGKQGDTPTPSEKKRAVRITVPGAGCQPYAFNPPTWQADSGDIGLLISAYRVPMGATFEEHDKNYKKKQVKLHAIDGLWNYWLNGMDQRETYFYYNTILGANRLVNWLAARPDVDKSKFWYDGTSQGGGFGLILSSLNSNITRAAIHVPALCDMLGAKLGRQSGWPRPLEQLKGDYWTPEKIASAEKVLPYFDALNFARHIKCPIRMSVGFIDTTCPPSSVYAAYNVIQSPKQMEHGLGMPHSVFKEVYAKLNIAKD